MVAAKVKYGAEHITELLRARHPAKDGVFVPECRTDSSYSDGMVILDAWALVKTWSPWTTVGYEIKVSRSDFEHDQKWHLYLPHCHLFYFACPAGMIRATDLPEGVGLLWVGQNGTKLHTKVRASRRTPDPEKLCRLMSYVLMSRSVMVADMHEANRGEVPEREQTKLQRLQDEREWVELVEKRKELARCVHGNVRRRLEEMKQEVFLANSLHEDTKEFSRRLARLGIFWDPEKHDWIGRHRVWREIDALVGALDGHTLQSLDDAARKITDVVQLVEKLRQSAAAEAERKAG